MDYTFLIELEKQLLQPYLRNDEVALDDILHHNFFEFGSSGRKLDRMTIIKSLTAENGVNYAISDFSVHPISDSVVLIAYETESVGHKELRSSIWKKSGSSWKLFFHQGTKMG